MGFTIKMKEKHKTPLKHWWFLRSFTQLAFFDEFFKIIQVFVLSAMTSVKRSNQTSTFGEFA